MQAETLKAGGVHQKQGTPPHTPTTPLPPAPPMPVAMPVIPEGCEKLYEAIHAGTDGGHMTWTK